MYKIHIHYACSRTFPQPESARHPVGSASWKVALLDTGSPSKCSLTPHHFPRRPEDNSLQMYQCKGTMICISGPHTHIHTHSRRHTCVHTDPDTRRSSKTHIHTFTCENTDADTQTHNVCTFSHTHSQTHSRSLSHTLTRTLSL